MATVFIPTLLRPVTDGRETLEVKGATVGEVVGEMTARYPELRSRLLDGSQLRGNISVAIDGEVSTLGLLDSLREDSEIHFVPAISGGRMESDADALG